MAASSETLLFEARAVVRDAQRDFEHLARTVERIPDVTTKDIEIATGNTIQELDRIKAELDSIDRKTVTPEFDFAIRQGLAKIEAIKAQLASIPNRKDVNIDIDKRGNLLGEIAGMERGLLGLMGALGKAAESSSGFSESLSKAFFGIKSIGPFVSGLAIVIISSLVPALIALGASFLSAAGGAGGLATALLGALGPAIGLIVALFARFSKIMEARKAQQQATNASIKEGAKAEQEAAQEAERRIQAEEAIRDALQAVEGAERRLADARKQAADAIRQANVEVAQAHEAVIQAQLRVRDATIQAQRDMQDAIERTRDAAMELEDAQLSQEEAALGVREAELELEKFRNEAGLATDSLDALFKKFQDVDFDPSQLRAALRSAAASQGKSLSGEDELKLEQMILRVRRARLGEKEANDRVRDSEEGLARSHQDEARARQDQINGIGPVRDATNDLTEARRREAEAVRKANELNQQGIEKAPAVISAMEAIRDANERLAEARRKAAQPANIGAAESALDVAQQKFDALSAAEQRFLTGLNQIATFLTGFFGPATDAVMGGLASALQNIPTLLAPIQSAFTLLGQTWGTIIDTFSAQLINPAIVAGFQQLVVAAARLSTILGGQAFVAFLQIVTNLANAFMPHLVALSQQLANWLTQVAAATTGVGSANPTIVAMVTSFRAWMRLIKAVFGLFGPLIRVVSPFGNEMVKWLTQVVQKFAAWVNSKPGTLTAFFRNLIPLSKTILTFLGKLGSVIANALTIAAPFIQGFIGALNTVLSVVNFILGILARIFGNAIVGGIARLIGAFLGFGWVLRIFKLIAKAIELTIGVLTKLGRAPGTVVAFFLKQFQRLLDWLGKLPTVLFGLMSKAVEFLLRPFQGIADAVLAFFRPIVSGIKWVFNQVLSVVNGIIKGVNNAIDVMRKLPNIPGIPGLDPKNLPRIPEIPKLASGGILGGEGLFFGHSNEAVLPLTNSVLGSLGEAIVRNMPMWSKSRAPVAAGPNGIDRGVGTLIENQTIVLPEPPSGGIPDARMSAALLADELRRRGGS